MPEQETDRLSNDDCSHTHPIPAEEVQRYSPNRDPSLESDIAAYVESQTRDEIVQHVEKTKDEIVMGERYDIWDVVTDTNRWWVIGNLTNLYSQKHFPSLDYTLSFHIGLMLRMRENNARGLEDDHAPFDEIWRRQQQIKDRFDLCVEPEEFQSIGLQLRECLMSLMSTIRRHIEISDQLHPKEADFIGWCDLLMNALLPSSSNKQLRHYMKALAKETWQLANWLAHDRDANSAATSICMHSCDTLIGHIVQLLVRRKTDNIETCPRCGSRDLRTHFDIAIGENGDYYSTCGSCDWSSYPSDQP
jgi:hypothetical protein